MYLSYYNLKAKPFQMSTDPAFLWLGEKHREALAVLKYAIMENKGVLALTGDVGTGKTTLINALLNSLGEDTITATIYDSRLEVIDFFNTVAAAFQIEQTFDGKGKFILQFMDFLIKAHERKKKVLLIIDEAQGINEDLLEELRLLSNLEAEYTRLLNIFFVGQNEFIDILQKYENRALRQRVAIRYHIDPLTLNETADYIKYRLKVAGTEAPIFDSGAIDEIFFFSGGYPRLINIMCDHALLSGYVRELQVINADLIRECREELLVSKKKSERDFQDPGNDYRSLPSETMINEPPQSSEAMFTESRKDSSFAPVEDHHNQDDEPEVFSRPLTARELARQGKPPKRRFFRSSIFIVFLLLTGIAAGYFFYESDKNKAESFDTSARQQSKTYFPAKEGSKNDKPPMVPISPQTSDIPSRVEAGKVGDSRFYMVKSPNSGLLKETIPKETEMPQVTPSNKVPEEKGELTDTTKPVDSEQANMRQKAPLMVPITEKKPDKIEALTQVSSKIESTLSNAGAASSDIEKKKPMTASAPKAKQNKINPLVQKPVQVPKKPKVSETLSAKAVKPVEKPETRAAVTKPLQAQKKTSESRQAKPQVKRKEKAESPKSTETEKETPAVSSINSDPQASTLAAIPFVPTTEKTVHPKKGLSGEDKIVSQEKAQASLPVRKKKTAENRADKKVISLSEPSGKSDTAVQADFNQFNLYARLKEFLNEYCQTYEQKDLDKFGTFFAANAVEKGKPFKLWLSKYRQTFNRLDLIEYDIELERYATQKASGLVKIDGTFHVRAKLNGSKEWRKSSGQISMVLEADGDSFKVKELDY